MTKTEKKVEELVNPIIEKLGYDLYDVEYVKEGKDYFLKIYIDNKNGISLNDCEIVSNRITEILDKEDIIIEKYFLEVSSPGIERILKKDKHLELNLGNNVRIKLFRAESNQRQYTGILKNYDKTKISIIIDDKIVDIQRSNIVQIKTIYNW